MAKRPNEFKRRGNEYFHKFCGGELAITARGYRRLPLGFGFAGGDSRFRVDYVNQPLVKGFCLKCGAKGEFAGKVRKRVYTKFPKVGAK